MDRRGLLRSIVSAAAAAAAPRLGDCAPADLQAASALFFVPGYEPDRGRVGDVPLTQHPDFTAALPRGYDGPLTLIARLDERDRSVRRALMPLQGHHVAIDPRGRQAFFSAMNGAQMVRFDPHSLALLDVVQPHAHGFLGGGHAAWTRDGKTLINTERRPYRRYTGAPADHRGRLVVRDAGTMKVLAVYQSHGIAPHDLTLMEDDGLIAVANYGSTLQAKPAEDAKNPYRIVEPRLSLIDLRSGRLVDGFAPTDNAYEIRHLAARDRAHLFAVAADFRRAEDVAPLLSADRQNPVADTNSATDMAFAPAPLIARRRSRSGAQNVAIMPADRLDFREGQTAAYDPAHDEVIATFASSHVLAVVDAKSFDLKRVVATDKIGLQHPRGIALHPDGRRYAVSGSWAGLYFFARGSHAHDAAATWNEAFFNHSHITAVPVPGT